jgi:hypothetical protein
MLTSDDIENLPDDRDQAFAIIAEKLDEYVSKLEQDFGMREARLCAEEIGAYLHATETIDDYPRLNFRVPRDSDEFWDWWNDFSAAVHFYRTKARLKKSSGPLTVILDADHRARIHALLGQIRHIVPRLEVTVRKKDAIFAHIARLESEVDRQKTSTESFWALMMEGGSALGKAGTEAEPFIAALERVKKVFFEAKAQDIPPQLPAPDKPKQLPPPKPKATLDDDIPFE